MRALLALLLAAAAATAAGVQARDPLQAIDECVTRLDNELDVGYARIAARCPQLAATLGESAFAPWLPADWKRPDNELAVEPRDAFIDRLEWVARLHAGRGRSREQQREQRPRHAVRPSPRCVARDRHPLCGL